MNYCIDLILGKAFWIFIFFHFPDSRLFVLTDFHFYFCFLTWVKTENLLYPFVKNDLKLCVNHQFIAPLLYNQITQLIFITDIFRPKVQHFLAARFVCARSAVFCQNFWLITQRLPGNWRGGGKRFSGAFRKANKHASFVTNKKPQRKLFISTGFFWFRNYNRKDQCWQDM